MGINTNIYLPISAEVPMVVGAIRNLTDADSVMLKPGGWLEEPTIIMNRGDEYVSGSSYYVLRIDRAEQFGDGDGMHEGSLTPMTYAHQGDKKPRPALNVHGGNASAFWCALGVGLVDVFGGRVDFNDCDAEDTDYERRAKLPSRYYGNNPEFEAVRKAMDNIAVVTDVDGLSLFDKVPGIYNRQGGFNKEDRS